MKLLKVTMIFFVIICFIGTVYVEYSVREYNVQYVIPPLLFFSTWFQEYYVFKRETKQN